MIDFRVVSAGDSAIVVEFEERIDPAVNARAISLAEAIEGVAIAGVRDVVPTYRSVAIYFDPLRTDYDRLLTEVHAHAPRAPATAAAAAPPIRIPVCYGGELGPDLPAVAKFGQVSEDEAVQIHTAGVYRVFMLGFVPGFAYMGIVDAKIAAPRHPTPRVRVPSGAVGIAGVQTRIYPAETPGAYYYLAIVKIMYFDEPAKPFDAGRPAPFLLKAGDGVQFYAIDRVEYDGLT